MKFNKEVASLHAYLCADGYVIKNPETQKKKYYMIGLRNTNNILLNDFKDKIEKNFNVKAYLCKDGRCRVQSKELYQCLTKEFSYYCREWKLPNLSKTNLKEWLRSFFDCEAWIELQKAKSRAVRIDCTNEEGIKNIQSALNSFNIKSSIKPKKDLWRLSICGQDDLIKFQKQINFLHPEKRDLLIKAINSYKNYKWEIPLEKELLFKFINKQGRVNKSKTEIRLYSIKKSNLFKLKKTLKMYGIKSKVHGPYNNKYGSTYYYLTIKDKMENLWIQKN